jgi:hypothetical protein
MFRLHTLVTGRYLAIFENSFITPLFKFVLFLLKRPIFKHTDIKNPVVKLIQSRNNLDKSKY